MTVQPLDSDFTLLGRADVKTPRTKPSTDYRLRGLDLEAQGSAEPPVQPKRRRRPSRLRRIRVVQTVVVLAVAALVAFLLQSYVVQSYSVRSTSMVPTIQPGTDVLVMTSKALGGDLELGDVVVTHQPEGARCTSGEAASQDVVKRIIGMPGETIWSDGQLIYVDGKQLEEPGWYNVPFGEVGTSEIERTTIPQGSYFLLGDNRTDPCDSRSFGPVPGSDIVGEVIASTTRDGHPYVHSI